MLSSTLAGLRSLLENTRYTIRHGVPPPWRQQQEEHLQVPSYVTTPQFGGRPAYEVVESEFTLPFPLYQFQQGAVNDLAPRPGAGYWLDTGTGKTPTSTASMLYKLAQNDVGQFIVLMPPILLRGWKRFLDKIPEVSAMIYAGSPRERADMKFTSEFTLMSPEIFKKDYERIQSVFAKRRVGVTVDEATSVKGITSQTHKRFRDFTVDRPRLLLSGTPLSTPRDAYAYCKLIAPGTYRNLQHFENVHVAERDFFGAITAWKNLELLEQNMRINAVRVLKRDVLHELPETVYDPIYYQLDPAHKRLYRKLSDEELLVYENGTKFDATDTSRLQHAIQQIVLNWAHFAQEPSRVSAGEAVLQEVLDELAGRKLLCFTQYRMTNAMLLARFKPYGAVAIYGGQTSSENNRALDRFLADESCRVIFAQPKSAGYGVDGMQEVCSDVLFLEAPQHARDFHQSIARVERAGQKEKIHVRIAVAEGTVQVRKFKDLLANDELLGKVQPNFKDLKAAINGE